MGEAPPDPDEALHGALRAAVEATRAASSAWRPAVAEYLFRHGLAPLHAALAGRGPVPHPLVEGVWRLMLETVATRRFGVSTDAWRAGDYPDRYFPLVWLDLLPARLPAVAPEQRMAAVAALFNLGERLPRSVATPVARRLVAEGHAFAADPLGALRRLSREAGLLGDGQAPTGWRRLVEQGVFDCAQVDPRFLPGAIAAGPERRFVVVDALRPVALHLDIDSGGPVCRATGAAPPAVTPERAVELDGVRLTFDRRALRWQGALGAGHHPLDGVAPAALAANPAGDVLWVDAASTRVRWLRAGG